MNGEELDVAGKDGEYKTVGAKIMKVRIKEKLMEIADNT